MEKFLNMLPGLTALVLVIGAYWQLKIKSDNNEKGISDVKDDCYDKMISEKERSDERDMKHDKEIESLWKKVDEKASRESMMEIKSDLGRQYEKVMSEIVGLRELIMQLITKSK